jgi:hypothetical protein
MGLACPLCMAWLSLEGIGDKKWVGLEFGHFFLKLIWPP